MNRATGASTQGPTTQWEQAHTQGVGPLQLPWWKDLPPEYHHELVMVLSTIVVKRLSAQEGRKPEVTGE